MPLLEDLIGTAISCSAASTEATSGKGWFSLIDLYDMEDILHAVHVRLEMIMWKDTGQIMKK